MSSASLCYLVVMSKIGAVVPAAEDRAKIDLATIWLYLCIPMRLSRQLSTLVRCLQRVIATCRICFEAHVHRMAHVCGRTARARR